MAKAIYPGGLRENYFVNMYCEMAMESYYNAKVAHDIIKGSGYTWDCSDKCDLMNKSIISTIVFSAMTVEAFINNYAAACLGDVVFTKHIDRLSTLSKFEFISIFILRRDIDKSRSYYSLLKSLFSKRNSYIHSKSKRSAFQGYTLEQMKEIENLCKLDEFDSEPPLLNAKEIEADMRDALNALKAIKELAIYFDENDSNIFAKSNLFNSSGVRWWPSKERQYRLLVLQQLNIKVDKL